MLRYSTALIMALCVASSAAAQVDQVTISSPLERAQLAVLPPTLNGVVSALSSNEALWAKVHTAQAVRIVDVPFGPNRVVTLQLNRIEPFAPDAVIVEMVDGPNGMPVEHVLPKPDADYFSGIIEGDPTSRAVLTHSVAGVHGYAQDDSGVYVISNGPPSTPHPILSYKMSDLPEGAINWDTWHCETREAGPVFMLNSEGGVASDNPCRQVKIAIETDYEFSTLFNSNTTVSAAYVGTLLAGMLDIYKRDLNVLVQMTYLRLWATPDDPWNAPDAGAALDQFRAYWLANMTLIQRNTAHFLSARGLGGGVAYMSALCGSLAYGVEGNMGGFYPYPTIDNSTQNWDIMVLAHEVGHNFGAPHTHDYCPPLDSCAPSGYFGQCQTQQICISNGTIMSYCHLCDGATANIVMKFHDQNIVSMSSYLGAGGTCNLMGTSLPPVGVNDYITVPRGIETDLDVMSNELAFNCEAVTIGSFLATTSQGGTVTLISGGGPGGRDVLRYLSPPGFTGQDIVWYRLLDSSSQLSSFVFAYLDVQVFRFPDNPVGDLPGLDAKYYNLSSPTVVPDFDSMSPYLTTTVTQINFASTNGNFANSTHSDNVGARWTGFVSVPQTGLYTFTTTSDDGSILKIGTLPVVVNDGLHAMQERSGGVGLLAGKHAITVDFFEAGGGAGCIVQLSGPGIAKAPIPALSFTRGGVSNPFDINGDGFVDGADLGMLLAAFNTSAAYADFNHDGTVDGADLGAMLAAWGS